MYGVPCFSNVKHFRPRKALGQAFLTYEPTADALAGALEVGAGDTVLEIGPGKGILTRRLVERAGRVIAVEVDERLVQMLRAEMSGHANLEVVSADFMRYDLSAFSRLKVMGNLPYNLSSQMLLRLLDFSGSWEMAVLTTQREFAMRILGEPGTKSYGALTVFFERLTERERLFNIPPDHFKPKPDVVSTAFRMVRRHKPLFEVEDEASFRRIVKVCFSQRRKTIANNIAAGLGLDKQDVAQVLAGCDVDPGARAETLAPSDFKRLADALTSGVTEAARAPVGA